MKSIETIEAVGVLLVVVLLGGCGEGTIGGAPPAAKAGSASGLDQVPDAGPCDSIVAGGGRIEWSVEPGCPGCSVIEPQLAVDHDLATGASLHIPAGAGRAGGIELRATAPAGTVFPESVVASALVTDPSSPNVLLHWTAVVRTLLRGQIQESRGYTNQVGGFRGGPWLQPYSVRPTRPYDAVAFYVAMPESATDMAYVVNELCVDFE